MDAVRFLQVALHPRVTFAADVSRGVLDRPHRQAHDACSLPTPSPARSGSTSMRPVATQTQLTHAILA